MAGKNRREKIGRGKKRRDNFAAKCQPLPPPLAQKTNARVDRATRALEYLEE
jgi:hypothetical protein